VPVNVLYAAAAGESEIGELKALFGHLLAEVDPAGALHPE
jgi:hypothetical protein